MGSADNEDFNAKIIKAVDDKVSWFNSTVLPKVQEGYRNHLIFVKNLTNALQRRSLITPDPYQNDKKITDVGPIDDAPFNDAERATQLGIRLGQYENMVDFICTYVKFSVEQLPTAKIKKLVDFNGSFSWDALNPESARQNTKALGAALMELKTTTQGGGPAMSMLFDSIAKTSKDMEEMSRELKSVGAFQKERYKGEIRKEIVSKLGPYVRGNASALMEEIKKQMPTALPRRPFSADIVEELVKEESAPNKDGLRSKLLQHLKVQEMPTEKAEESVNVHEIIMGAVLSLGSMSDQYNIVMGKVVTNHDILASEDKGFKQKLGRFFRRLFGMAEPQVEYEVIINKKGTDEKQREIINYNSFMAAFSKRIKFYTSLSSTDSPNYQKMNSQADDFVFNWVNKQMTENGRLQVLLGALDEYFKANTSGVNRAKIKGIKMELTTLKNVLVKVNQLRSEYASYVEEAEQMKKLGITK
ncbi:MAG: hypothetical protein II837_12010 [Treponema sp.]|nr:hypothetical protein [Treponema sp.]